MQVESIRHCADGGLLVFTDEGRLQFSIQQAQILLAVYSRAHLRHRHQCLRSDVHQLVFGHSQLPRGRARGAVATEVDPLSASKRASLSRAVRTLAEQGLIERRPVVLQLTDDGVSIASGIRPTMMQRGFPVASNEWDEQS